jgi:hypothetical protein
MYQSVPSHRACPRPSGAPARDQRLRSLAHLSSVHGPRSAPRMGHASSAVRLQPVAGGGEGTDRDVDFIR